MFAWAGVDFVVQYEKITLQRSVTDGGYFGSTYKLAGTKSPCGAASLLWSGERAVVLKCPDGAIHVQMNAQDLDIVQPAVTRRVKKAIYLPTSTDFDHRPIMAFGNIPTVIYEMITYKSKKPRAKAAAPSSPQKP